jgi:hypothetical protein
VNDERSFERTAREWLELGANQAPDRAVQSVLLAIETTPQERDLRIPWRFPRMNKLIPIGLGAAAVVLLVVAGSQLLGTPAPSGVGGAPATSPSPSRTPSPTPSNSPSPSPAASPPPLTQTFTSQMHGISMSYPEGWIARAATVPWTGCLYCTGVLEASYIDVLHRPPDDDGLFLRIASQPIGESAFEDWVAPQMASDDRCTTTEPIIVDGATGLSGGDTCLVAVVTTAGRGYHIDLWMSPDDRDLVAQYDRAWFEEVLATVQLHPEDAVDVAPSAAP